MWTNAFVTKGRAEYCREYSDLQKFSRLHFVSILRSNDINWCLDWYKLNTLVRPRVLTETCYKHRMTVWIIDVRIFLRHMRTARLSRQQNQNRKVISCNKCGILVKINCPYTWISQTRHVTLLQNREFHEIVISYGTE